jgi:hypothetical protein
MAQGGFTKGFVVGLAVGVVAPLAITAIAVGTGPLARAIRRGGTVLGDKAREAAAEFGEIAEDMMAEARAQQHARFEQRERPRRPTTMAGEAGRKPTA